MYIYLLIYMHVCQGLHKMYSSGNMLLRKNGEKYDLIILYPYCFLFENPEHPKNCVIEQQRSY